MSWYCLKVYGFLFLLVASCLPTRAQNNVRPYVRMLNGFPNVTCNFETSCSWKWSPDSFSNISASTLKVKLANHQFYEAPLADADDNEDGHYLFVFDTNQRRRELNITSPGINPAFFDKNINEFCTLLVSLNTYPRQSGNISVLIQEGNRTKVIAHHLHNDDEGWHVRKINLGHPEEIFNIILEIGSSPPGSSYVAIDNIELQHCFPDLSEGECPPARKFRCAKDSVCIPMNMVCDIKRDCSDSEDEKQNCDKVPVGTRCTFENGWCGWSNTTDKHHTLRWRLNRGPTRNKHTGPSYDNTFGTENGTYAYVDMSSGTLGSLALMESLEINPPPPVHGDPHSPHYNSCYVTFFYHKFGPHSGSLGLYLRELKVDGPRQSMRLWWSYGNKGDQWLRQVVVLPNITEKYTIQFEARKSMSSRGDVAIDDISLSPKCFGIGIPEKELNGYNYLEYPKINTQSMHEAFANKPVYTFTTCGTLGSRGPTPENCETAYNNTLTRVTVLQTPNMTGFQKWLVPETSYYTIIAKGGRGGKGADALGESRSTMVRIVTELYEGQSIYMLVGQEGQDACKKLSFDTPSCVADFHFRTTAQFKSYLRDHKFKDGGGGGGGATYIFTMENGREPVPVLVAAGGGGLAHGPFVDNGRQHGNGINASLPNITAPSIGNYPAGAGGGWRDVGNFTKTNSTGTALLEGGAGGSPCYSSTDQVKGTGGFGGGGGGCVAGGGGGGYTGGRAWSDSHTNGEGGWSMIGEHALYADVKPGLHYGPGLVTIIPAIEGCGCAHGCVAADEARTAVKCICSSGWILTQDGRTCTPLNGHVGVTFVSWRLIVALVLLSAAVIVAVYYTYKHFLKDRSEKTQRKVCGGGGGAGLQLNHLNWAPMSVRLSELNPNYEFGGRNYTIEDLREIPRDKVYLVKPIGSGAFGDVYQGLLKQNRSDKVDMAVAVKILPALSSNQAESDFLMEALIMSKFKHPNIVHFIGCCFDTHPRYIILELLGGGDLKTFLRRNRPRLGKPSCLTMRDLIQMAVDIAKGCEYLEERRFIHRDIAARNCLLTTGGPGRTVKIADFGMSRDIYGAEYYKKGGKAMLPIKWMPPEAFLDGIFSVRTDVWSFGVVMWEIMSLGFMPYTGIRNRDVMAIVARGARLGVPANCPPPIYGLMEQCWSHDPNKRPSFATILERLGYCIQDPEVVNTPLPVYSGPLPSELDQTVMRPPANEEDEENSDYLTPRMPETILPWNGGSSNADVKQKYMVDDHPSTPRSLMESSSGCSSMNSKINHNKSNGSSPQHVVTKTNSSNFNIPNDTYLSESSKGRPFILSGQYVKDPPSN